MKTFSIAFLAALPMSFAVTGCQQALEEDIATASAASAIQSSNNASKTSTISSAAHDLVLTNTCVTPEGVAAMCAAEPNVGVYPEDCAKKTASGASLTVDYDNCTGVFGDVDYNGSADASFSKGSACNEVVADVRDGGDLTANGAPLTYDATVDITVNPGSADVTWDGTWEAKTSYGPAQGSDHLTLTQDLTSYCLSGVAGTGAATLDSWRVNSKLDGFAVCPGACPTAGTLDVTAADGAWEGHITITFDGTATAHATGSKGNKFDVKLVCEGK